MPILTRRDWLIRTANGFGALALADLLHSQASAELHHPAKADHVIFLYMDGGPSQVDTFDPKPRLAKEHGQPIKMKIAPTQFNNIGKMLQSPWKFKQYGQSGIPVSELFPHMSPSTSTSWHRPLDDVELFRAHQRQLFLHTGRAAGPAQHGGLVRLRPGHRVKKLPGFVVLNGGLIPPGGIDNLQWASSGHVPGIDLQCRRRAGGQHPSHGTQAVAAAETSSLW